jgi:retron-type reverse transcriptase
VDRQKSTEGKPFDISKREVWEAYETVKANKGAPGVDGCSIEEFDRDLKNNLYKIWNRMSSGSYLPPPVRAVEIPKASGGTRILGVPTVADRIAQTVVARRLEAVVEPKFHPDSYGYRPGRSALDAVAVCRERSWRIAWVVDLDIQKFFDSVPWDLVVKAVEANTDLPWVVLYVKRWLEAPLRLPDGTQQTRDRGTPQGSLCSAEHKEPNEQRWVMRSVDLLSLVRVVPRAPSKLVDHGSDLGGCMGAGVGAGSSGTSIVCFGLLFGMSRFGRSPLVRWSGSTLCWMRTIGWGIGSLAR